MHALDLACVVIVALAAAAGAITGAASQLVSAGAVGAGWAGAHVVAPRLAPLLRGHVPAFAAHPLSSLAAFALCATVAGLALRALAAAVHRRGPAGRADRGLGALLGGAKAAVVLWVVLSALAAWGRPVRLGPASLDPAGSELVAAARDHSAFALARP